jgi:hypothetical protein
LPPPLSSCSLLSLLELSSREATRRARDKIRNAIRASEAVSLVVGLRVLPQSVFTLGLGSKKTRESAASEGLKRVALSVPCGVLAVVVREDCRLTGCPSSQTHGTSTGT